MKTTRIMAVLLTVILFFPTFAYSKKALETPPSVTPAATSLYDRLGGESGITDVVDEFVSLASADSKVNFTRAGTQREWDATSENVAHLKTQLVNLIGSLTGGPQLYEGRDMFTAHQGMRITNAEFDALADDLIAALSKFEVGSVEQGELINIVEGTRGSIVEVNEQAVVEPVTPAQEEKKEEHV